MISDRPEKYGSGAEASLSFNVFNTKYRTVKNFVNQSIKEINKYFKSVNFDQLFSEINQRNILNRLKLLRLDQESVNCCGIIGYIGFQNAEPILMNGIRILQNRGYDSCGISTINEKGKFITTKYASRGTTSDSIELLAETAFLHSGHHIGIGHTRWATHGAKVDYNAHPHTDHKERISLVHNGTIDNYTSLRKRLQSSGIEFKTETDTEVIANLISFYLDKNLDLEKCVQEACKELLGTWGLAVIHKDYSDQMVLARNGSPLIVGSTEREIFVASEVAALANHTNEFFSLRDKETCLIKIGRIQRFTESREKQKIELEFYTVDPAPYSHWMLKEIYEQPVSLKRAMNYGGRLSTVSKTAKLRGLDDSISELKKIRHLIITGCGTSLYAGMYGEKLIRQFRCFDSVFSYDASELTEDCFAKSKAGLLLLSQSGETLDVIRACNLGQAHGVHCFSIVNSVGSHLARLTDCGVYLNAGREVAVASTKAFTSQIIILALITVWFSQHHEDRCEQRESLLKEIQRISDDVSTVLSLENQIKSMAQQLYRKSSLFLLGKGFGHPVVLEGALKIKEVAYIHAEGSPAGSLKHGPFALISEEEATPVILLIMSDEHKLFMLNTAEQVKSRGASVYIIADNELTDLDHITKNIIYIPELGQLTGVLAAVVFQLLAYHMALLKEINPDKPRGLAKTVTVS